MICCFVFDYIDVKSVCVGGGDGGFGGGGHERRL